MGCIDRRHFAKKFYQIQPETNLVDNEHHVNVGFNPKLDRAYYSSQRGRDFLKLLLICDGWNIWLLICVHYFKQQVRLEIGFGAVKREKYIHTWLLTTVRISFNNSCHSSATGCSIIQLFKHRKLRQGSEIKKVNILERVP